MSNAFVRRRIDRDCLLSAAKLRLALLRASEVKSLRDAGAKAEDFASIAGGYEALAHTTDGLIESDDARIVSAAARIASNLARLIDSTLDAGADATRYAEAARMQATSFLQDLGDKSEQVQSKTSVEYTKWLNAVRDTRDAENAHLRIRELGLLPVPTFMSKAYDRYAGIRGTRATTTAEQDDHLSEPVVKLSFTIDGLQIGSPHALMSAVQYDIKADAEVNEWPQGDYQLQIDYISTMPKQSWSITELRIEHGEHSASGHLLISHPQSFLSEPAVLRVRARFVSLSGAVPIAALVIGQYELRIHALSASSYPILTQYPVLDVQVVKVVEAARSVLPAVSQSDFEDFQKCVVLISKYAAVVQQQGTFKRGAYKNRKLDEKKDFQQHILEHLRMQLGPDVIEGASMAGGLLDLKYHNIVIELKVEYGVKDRDSLRSKYVEQPTQYSSTGILLSITCILDMTEKDSPPANVANNITLEDVKTHGFEDRVEPYPSKVAVIIIDGNTKSPSDYS